MPSNYPPGVTGNEPQIAGYPECDKHGPYGDAECPGCREDRGLPPFSEPEPEECEGCGVEQSSQMDWPCRDCGLCEDCCGNPELEFSCAAGDAE